MNVSRDGALIQDILELLAFCLNTTYFSFKKELYIQMQGAAIGSLVSLLVANVYGVV